MTPADFRDCAIAVFLLSLSAPIWLSVWGELWMWWTWRPLEWEEEDDSQHRASPPHPNDDAD